MAFLSTVYVNFEPFKDKTLDKAVSWLEITK